MRKVLWWLIGGARGGENRFRIIQALNEKPMNANQLANELDLDYQTVRHHLKLLEENAILETMGEKYGKMYFLTDQMHSNLDVLQKIGEESGVVHTDDEP